MFNAGLGKFVKAAGYSESLNKTILTQNNL